MKFKANKFEQGYTLLELIIIVVIIGVLSGIIAPSWLAFLNGQRLNVAQAETLTIMREAQANAKRQKRVWEACFRQNDTENKVQWSVHPMLDSARESCENARWQDLIRENAGRIAIDTSRSTPRSSRKIYRVIFNHKGRVSGALGKVTFMIPNSGNNSARRCVYISTLLGALRKDLNQGCNNNNN